MADATAQAAMNEIGDARQAPPSSFLLRAGLVMGAWTTIHLAVVAALARPYVPGGWWSVLVAYLFLLAGIAMLLTSFREGSYPSKWRRLLVMRPFWYAQIMIFPMSLAGALVWLVGLPFGRGALWGGLAVLSMGAIMALVSLAGYVGSQWLVVKKLEFAFDDLPASFDGVKIAQLSDLHVGPHTSASFLARIVKSVEAAKPDIVAFTGDQVDDYDQDVARFAQVFGHLRGTHGAFAIAGNHDVYAGWPGVKAGMEAAGMSVLVNHAVPIRRGEHELWMIGTGDPAGGQPGLASPHSPAPDIARSLSQVPQGAFTVALAHNPALWPALAQRGVHLTLSGHTHHGQLSIPAINWSLASPFLELAMGTHARGRSRLYINPGTNYWALPLRLGAWPEVTIVTLRRRDGSGSGTAAPT